MSDYERQMQLADQLENATAPSETPDENCRPCHWSDRIYGLCRQVDFHAGFYGRINWNQAGHYIAMDVAKAAFNCGKFDELQAIVTRELEKRTAPKPA